MPGFFSETATFSELLISGKRASSPHATIDWRGKLDVIGQYAKQWGAAYEHPSEVAEMLGALLVLPLVSSFVAICTPMIGAFYVTKSLITDGKSQAKRDLQEFSWGFLAAVIVTFAPIIASIGKLIGTLLDYHPGGIDADNDIDYPKPGFAG